MYKRVEPEGSEAAEVVLIGEAPAREESERGRPFVGSAGQYLDNFLRMSGLFRGELYITNILKYRAPGDKIDRVPLEELQTARTELIEEINSLENVKVIVPLGKYAMETVTDRRGITNFRGSPLHPVEAIRHDCVVVPTFHPSKVHYAYRDTWPYIVADFTKIKRIKDQGFEFPTFNFRIQPTFEEVIETLRMLRDANHPMVVIDVENPHRLLSCIGLAWSRRDAISIPFYWGNGRDYWTLDEEIAIWRELGNVLPELNLAGQNVMYDWEVMLNHNIVLKTPYYDSMLMHACLYSELPHNLEFITSVYTDIPFYKRDEDEDTKRSSIRAGMERDHWEYNMYDCVATFWAIEELEAELIEEKMDGVYRELFAELIGIIFEMNMRGVPVDIDKLPAVREELDKTIGDKISRLNEELGYEINPNSYPQVRKALFEDLKMTPYRDKYGKVSTDKKALEKLAYKYNSEVPTLISDIREDRSFVKMFDDENIEDGRFKTRYTLSVTRTGRLSSRKTTSGKGRNLQNVKRGKARSFFVAEKGHLMVGADQCWPAGTLIETPNGQVPIEEMQKGDYVYSYRDKSIKINKVKAAFSTGIKPLMKVLVRSGHNWTTFIATPTHRIYLSDGTKKMVKDLTYGDSLMHFQRTVSANRNLLRLNRFFQKRETRIIGEEMLGATENDIIHHKDGNSLNDHLENLEVMTQSKHSKLHNTFQYVDEETRIEALREAIKEIPDWNVGKKNPRWDASKDRVCQHCGKPYHMNRHHTSEKYCSPECYYAHERPRYYSYTVVKEGNFTFVEKEDLPSATVYNMEVERDHNYILANGIVSSNCQAEARLTAYLSQDETYITAAESGELYFRVGQDVFGQEIEKGSKLYNITKSLVHGSNYSIGPFGFAYAAGIPYAEAKSHLETFHRTYPGIKSNYYAYIEECIRKTRTVYNPFGRRLIVFDYINDSTFRLGYAFIPQSTSGDITKIAMKRVAKHYEVLMELHDGLYISVPEKEVRYGVEALKEAYDVRFKIWNIERTIPIDIKVGENWDNMKEVNI